MRAKFFRRKRVTMASQAVALDRLAAISSFFSGAFFGGVVVGFLGNLFGVEALVSASSFGIVVGVVSFVVFLFVLTWVMSRPLVPWSLRR